MAKTSSDTHVEALKARYLGQDCKDLVKYAIVTGWNEAGVGGEVSSVLQRHAWKVCAFTRSGLDVTEDHHIMDCAEIHQWSRGVALINCASIMDLQWFEEYSMDDVRRIIETNLVGAYAVSKEFVQRTLGTPWRKYIVHLGSMAARMPLNGSSPYCASKAGLEQLCRCMAFELAPKNYNVLCIHPSNIEDAPMSHETIKKICRFRNVSHKEAVDYWSTGLMRDAFLTKPEIANLIRMFVDGECDYLSGHAVCLAGGHR